MENLYNEISAWQKETFGDATAFSKIAHLKQEVIELKIALDYEKAFPTTTNFNDVRMEFADCFILLFGSAASYGFSHNDILNLIKEKFEINKK